MKATKLILAAILIGLFLGALSYCRSANAGEVITDQDILSAEKVYESQRGIKKISAGVGAIIGGTIGYQAATAAAMGPAGVVQAVVVNGIIWAGYMYGAASLGQEWGVHRTAQAIVKDRETQIANLKKQLDERVGKVSPKTKPAEKTAVSSNNFTSK